MLIGFLIGLLISINVCLFLTDWGDKLRKELNDYTPLFVTAVIIFNCTFIGFIASLIHTSNDLCI